MGQRVLSGPRIALYLAVVQWLVAALFHDRFELFYTLVPASTVMVVAAEAGLLVRTYAGENAGWALAKSIWCFMVAVLGFAVVSWTAAGRSPAPNSQGLWRGVEWLVTIGVASYVGVTWYRLEEVRQQ